MVSTPQRNVLNTTVFSPVRSPECPRTPKSDTLGLRVRIKTHAKTLLENHQKWLAVQARGITLCNQIEGIKKHALDECKHDATKSSYPNELRSPCAKFKVIITILADVLAASRDVVRQLDAIQRMNNAATVGIMFRSWDLQRLQKCAATLSEAYENEYPIRQKVMQEIAHAKTVEELVLHQSVWEFPCFVNEGALGVEMLALRYESEVEAIGSPMKEAGGRR